jgi:hypothetical protein
MFGKQTGQSFKNIGDGDGPHEAVAEVWVVVVAKPGVEMASAGRSNAHAEKS